MMHDAKFSSEPRSKSLGPVLRLAGFIVGADATVLEQTPAGERVQVKWAAFSVLLVFVFMTGAWSVGLSIARGRGIENVAAGALIGAVITMVDRAMIPFHWAAHGQRLARDHGLITATVRDSGSKALRAFSVFLRIAAAGVLSFVCSGFLDLALYERDIQSVLEEQYRTNNADLVREVEARLDRETRRAEDEIAVIAAERQAIRQRFEVAQDQRFQLRDVMFDTAVAERARLTAQRIAIAAEINAARQDAHAEEFGGARSDGTFVGVAARGPRFAEAIARQEVLTAQMNVIEAQIAALDERIEGTTSLTDQIAVNPDVAAQISALDARHSELGYELNVLKANRADAVAEAVQMDPTYVARPAGLIASAAALETLADLSPWLKSRILAVIVALVLLDLAALGILLMTPAPTVYAVQLACRQQNEIGRLVTQACAEAVQHAAQRASAISSIAEVEAELKQTSRQREQRAWLDAMIAEGFARKRAEPYETEAA
jgi:hypothetical protein